MTDERTAERAPIVAQCEPMQAVTEDGWCEWIHPIPGYLMQCCDCGLIHEMEFAIVKHDPENDPDTLSEGESDDGVIIFRARRYPRPAPQEKE
jgi:hypothetical protein